MWQAEVRVDLDAIRDNVAILRAGTTAEVMAVVKGDGYGHGMLPSARAALAGGATWLGVATLDEGLALRRGGLSDVPVLAWLHSPGMPLHDGVAAGIDLSAGSPHLVGELVAAARRAERTARVHLKIDTGLARGGATPAEWPVMLEDAAKAQADGDLEVVGVWSHFVAADSPGHETIDRQLAAFADALATAERFGIIPRYRHIANSAATLTRPDAHYDLVRPGIAVYGLSPVEGETFGLRPAMTARARVAQTKRVPAGQGVSYGHTYVTERETTLALVPLGYADGVPRAGSNAGPVQLGGKRRTVAGRVCMDQIVLDVGDDPVVAGDVATLFGPGDDGGPTADDWAAVVGTINYEIVTRFGSSRVPRVYDGTAGEPA
ncbi:alanine racemase [Paractinoplanes rishiriensis]|uniref:Alanine racemase n=1 Tax=Paractinoplanes rishiriensis TaxID=1050105 RepID=A0A919JWE2_9ACTN|nr:alanine racemase [Actinoplanes rishiriensis]GIE96060.1 alanine racemase [Actinoplanes rishiriensis]